MGAGSEQARKADYYFMEALRREAAGEPDAAFLMLRRAYMLDSVSGTDVGGLLGARLVALSRGDSVMMSAGSHGCLKSILPPIRPISMPG